MLLKFTAMELSQAGTPEINNETCRATLLIHLLLGIPPQTWYIGEWLDEDGGEGKFFNEYRLVVCAWEDSLEAGGWLSRGRCFIIYNLANRILNFCVRKGMKRKRKVKVSFGKHQSGTEGRSRLTWAMGFSFGG